MTRNRKTVISMAVISMVFIASMAYAETEFCTVDGAELLVWSKCHSGVENKEFTPRNITYASRFAGYCDGVMDCFSPENKKKLRKMKLKKKHWYNTVRDYLQEHPEYHNVCGQRIII